MSNHEYTLHTVAVGLLRGKQAYFSQRVDTLHFSGKWQFAGGKCEDGENPIDGAIRETLEETGLAFEPSRLQYLDSIYGDPTTYVCFVYVIELADNEIPKKVEDKMTEWQLFPLEEAAKLDLMPGLPNIIDKLQKLDTL